MTKFKAVQKPVTEILSKNECILRLKYPFAGEVLDIELLIHRELIEELLEKMDNGK